MQLTNHASPTKIDPLLAARRSAEGAIADFELSLRDTDRSLRRAQQTLPSESVREQIAQGLHECTDVLAQIVELWPELEVPLTEQFRREIGPWLYRSRLFWRSAFQPHGYAGDFRIIEWIYELEATLGQRDDQPGIVNCLDYAFSQINSTRALWARRERLRRIVEEELERVPTLRILDVACGGSRYVADAAATCDPARLHLTCVDQDASAIRFVERRFEALGLKSFSAHCGPLKELAQVTRDRRYDLVFSAGLFDYLDDGTARGLLSQFASLLNPGGLIAISNYHPDDDTAFLKKIAVNWDLIFRTEADLLRIMPKGMTGETERSSEGSLAFLFARVPSS